MSPGFLVRARQLGTAITLVVLACMFWPTTALAGGPTSALLVSPGTGQTAALYTSDPEYEQLMMLLDQPATRTHPDADPAPSVAADYVTVTWLIHDVTVWRIDRIFLAGSTGEPWIVTQTESGDPAATAVPLGSGMFPGEQGNDSAVWHRSADPAALMALLGKLGLLSAGVNTAVSDSSAAPMAAAAAVDPPARTAALWWALAGLLIGAVLMALVLRYLPAVRRRLLDDDDGQGRADQPRRMVEIPG
ncbi:MAG: hypothetical protein ABWZ02_03775 [Nakamurella sp.]